MDQVVTETEIKQSSGREAWIAQLPPEEKFLVFLSGETVYSEGSEGLPENLDLMYFEPDLRDLSDFKPRAVNSPEHETEEAEAGTTIYLDDKRQLKSRMVTSGFVDKIRLETLDLALQGLLPMLEAHTHPGESDVIRPSIRDFASLLRGDPKTGFRLVRAMIILGETSQLLAVVTNKTPIYDNDDECNNVVDELEDDAYGVLYEVDNRGLRRQEIIEDVKDIMIRRLVEARSIKPIDLSEVRTIIEKASRIQQKIQVSTQKKIEAMIPKHTGHIQKTADQLGIKLFTSTDFRHFTAIS